MPQPPTNSPGSNGVPLDDFPQVGTDAWGQMNRQRAELIRKKLRGEFSAEEQRLYDTLQCRSLEALERAFPPANDEESPADQTDSPPQEAPRDEVARADLPTPCNRMFAGMPRPVTGTIKITSRGWRDEFEFRCVYCLQREMWSRERAAVFSVDHIVPQSEDSNLLCIYANLAYACLRCNSARQDVRVLDPNQEGMGYHLRVESDGAVTGLTEEGLFLIDLLHLNRGSAPGERRRILRILDRRVKHPDDEGMKADFHEAFGYPEDLPDLRTLRPPEGNPLDVNLKHCFHALRAG